jgi:hypothetical protein
MNVLRPKSWFQIFSLAALLLTLTSCLFDEADRKAATQTADAQAALDALEKTLLEDPCMFKFDIEGASAFIKEGITTVYVKNESFSPAWQEMIDKLGLQASESDETVDILLPQNSMVDLLPSGFYIQIPDCDKPAGNADAVIIEEKEDNDCTISLSPPPPGTAVQPDLEAANRMFFPEGKTSKDWIQPLEDWNVNLVTMDPEVGKWNALLFPTAARIEREKDGSISIKMPECKKALQGAPIPTTEEMAEESCQVYTSPLPEGSTVAPCGHGRTCVNFPKGEIPDEWMNPAGPDWWMPLESPDEPGVWTALLAPGSNAETDDYGNTLVSQPHCFNSQRANARPSMDGDVINTGVLPDGARMLYDEAGDVTLELPGEATFVHSGDVTLVLPDDKSKENWAQLMEDGARIELQPNEMGSTTVVFPRGSTVTPKKDDTIDIQLGEGPPPTYAERMGWAWENNCTLLLGPKMPEKFAIIQDSNANLSIDTSPGAVTDAWTQAALKQGVGIYPQDNGDTKFRFRFDSTVEKLEDGRVRVGLSDCKVKEPAVLNTAFLPDSARVIDDKVGNVRIEIPDMDTSTDWQPLYEINKRLDIQPDGTGGYMVYFPYGSAAEAKPDGTFDITLSNGLPSTKQEHKGWAWGENCALDLGPQIPDFVVFIVDDTGQSWMVVTDGPDADAWIEAADIDGRIGVNFEEDGQVKFIFKYGSTVEEITNGTYRVTLPGCMAE